MSDDDILENCPTREQEQATNPNPVAHWQSG